MPIKRVDMTMVQRILTPHDTRTIADVVNQSNDRIAEHYS